MKKAIILVLIILVSGCVWQTSPYQLEFGGQLLNFRADLTQAKKVQVFPGEQILTEKILNPDVFLINITFIPNNSENGYYAVGAFELSFKLNTIRDYYGLNYKINSSSIESLDEITEKDGTINIIMLGPSQTNRTAIEVKDNIITLEGASFDSTVTKYSDLDLAIDKFLLVLMKS